MSIEIQPFSKQILCETLSNKLCPATNLAESGQIKYLAAYLRRLGCRSVVVEESYIDDEFLEDCVEYVGCHVPYPKICKRLHFFSAQLHGGSSERRATRLIDRIERGDPRYRGKTLRDSYLGFIVARPLPEAVIGRTVLKTWDDDGGRRRYCALRKYHAVLCGLRLTVESIGFQQQDADVAACATIALWSALQVSSDLFKVTAPSPARITRVANEVVTPSRVFPTDGLNPAQMCKAITSFGLEPDVFDFDRTGGIPILSLIHGYVSRMRLPVVLGIDVEGLSPHAVTIVGYSLRKKRVLEREVHPARYQIPLVGMRVDAVYAHDDQHGPFARMDVDVPRVLAYIQAAEEYAEKLKKAPETITDDERVQERCPVIFKGTWQVSGNLRALDPYVALIPVHSRIRVNYTKVLEWVSRLHRLMEISGLLMGVEHITEWDVYLSSTNLFKAEIIQQPNLCSDKLRRVLLSANLPKFIWRAVFSLGGAPLLDILFDATDMKLSLPIERLTISQPYLKKVFSKMLGSFQPDFLNRALSPRLLTLFQQAIADGSATVS